MEWSIIGEDNFIADISVTGSLSNGRSIIHSAQIFDQRIIYFFDSGAELYGAGDYYINLKPILGGKLLNLVADQNYIKEKQAGYSSTLGGTGDNVDMSNKSGGGNDIWSHGFWAHGGKTIKYTFELKTGNYYVNAGFYEWWNTQRNIKISVIGVNNKEIASKTFVLGKSDTRNQQSVKFSINYDQVVSISISKTSGSDPVLSWISILKES